MASIIREQRQTYCEYHPRTTANVWLVSSENNGKRIASIIREQRQTYGEYHPRTSANVWRVSSENNGKRMASIIREQQQTYGEYHPKTTANVWRVSSERPESASSIGQSTVHKNNPTHVICVLKLTLIKCTTCYFSVNVTIVLI